MVKLPDGTLRRIDRRTRKCRSKGARDLLVAEACARRWFIRRRVPCWIDPSPQGGAGRYGLLFRSGRRALVLPLEGPASTLSLDRVMKAKCDYLIAMELGEGTSGEPVGFLYWHDLPRGGDISSPVAISTLLPRRIDAFPELTGRPENFRMAYLAGSLRLLVRGESRVPPPLDGELPDRGYSDTTPQPDRKGTCE